MNLPKRSELCALFGEIIDGKWAKENDNMCLIGVPPDIAAKIHQSRIYCNKIIADPLRMALRNILDRGLLNELKSFDGCFNIRQSRSDSRQSVHSWGLAVDINAATNALGTDGDISKELMKCFTDEGFVWGGSWHRPDPMHFQWVEEV